MKDKQRTGQFNLPCFGLLGVTEWLKGHIRPAKTQEAYHMRQCYNEHCLGMKSKALILHVSQGELNPLNQLKPPATTPLQHFPQPSAILTKFCGSIFVLVKLYCVIYHMRY